MAFLIRTGRIASGLLLAWSLLGAAALAQELLDPRFAFAPDLAYDADVPSPTAFLGYEPGAAYTPYASVVAYLQALDAASDRVTMHRYGQTYEGRPLYTLVLTAPDHHARIEDIRAANLRLTDPDSLNDAGAEALIADHPAVLWLSYNVHGNEASSTETALQVAYRLAAAQDEETLDLLRHAVVILDPCINPDGRDRYVNWYNSHKSNVLNTNAEDFEHDEPWPGGRTNHYWFDLNRDWTWLVHPESQGRIAAYQQWMPQIHVDYHEQGFNNNYFTMPGTTPRNLNLPDAYDTWAERFGQGNIRAFDAHRITYFTREAFDFFYPGYGSSYPSLMGAIGMLNEQGGHSRGGRAVETEDGYVLTLRQRIFDHYLTSFATLRTAVDHRTELLRYFRAAFTPATNKSATRAYLFPDDPERSTYLYDVIGTLLAHGVRVERAGAAFTVGARDYWSGQSASRAFPAGTFVVRTDQPRHLLINTLLQRQMAIEDSVMYDMATWSAPLAYNLDAAWTESALSVTTEPVTEAPTPPAGLVNPNAQYAYAIDWRQRNAPKALARLWDAGYRVRSVEKSFGDSTRTFGPGTLVVLMGRNLQKVDSAATDMARIAREAGVTIVGLDSGRMPSGIDLTSRDSNPLKQPKVALLVDSPFSSYTAGQIWFLFDQWTGFGISRIRADALPGLDLDEYDVLILSDANNPGSVLDSTRIARLKAWVEAGGTLVATESTALFLAGKQGGLSGVALAEAPDAGDEEDEDEEDPHKPSYFTPYAARTDSSGLARIPGSAFRGLLDTSHPLAFGLPEHLYSLRFDTDALAPGDRLHTVGRYDPDPATLLASGYASRKNLQKLAGNTFAALWPHGQGHVVFLTDNTQYRMFWVGPARMLQNAVMLVPGL